MRLFLRLRVAFLVAALSAATIAGIISGRVRIRRIGGLIHWQDVTRGGSVYRRRAARNARTVTLAPSEYRRL